jgi:sugar lactone lactonase YvrE
MPFGSFAIEAGSRLNDGRCAPGGRHFWVGSMVETLDRPDAHLYRVDADGGTQTMVSGITCSNGLAWSPDGRTMYHADTLQGTVWAYDHDVNSGAISNKRVFFVVREGEGLPDGATVDAEGCYWSARYGGWRIVRHAPDGRELFVLKTPVQNPTMCAFAGDDLSTLVFTSARGSLDEEALRGQPDAGGVFAVDVAVSGLPEPDFQRRG